MPSAKSGAPGTIVPPSDPAEALDADQADPGAVESDKAEQRKMGVGKYGKQLVKAFKPAADDAPDEEKKTSWISLKLVDPDGQPIPGETYHVTLPDGSVASGSTDAQGMAKIEGFDPGQCHITFPNLDKSVWDPK